MNLVGGTELGHWTTGILALSKRTNPSLCHLHRRITTTPSICPCTSSPSTWNSYRSFVHMCLKRPAQDIPLPCRFDSRLVAKYQYLFVIIILSPPPFAQTHTETHLVLKMSDQRCGASGRSLVTRTAQSSFLEEESQVVGEVRRVWTVINHFPKAAAATL